MPPLAAQLTTSACNTKICQALCSGFGSRERGTARLEEAVAAYREALKEWTRERVPLDWAGTQAGS
jgi:hypothetical protein